MISLTDLKKTIALARVYNAKACKPTVLNFSNIEEVARTFRKRRFRHPSLFPVL